MFPSSANQPTGFYTINDILNENAALRAELNRIRSQMHDMSLQMSNLRQRNIILRNNLHACTRPAAGTKTNTANPYSLQESEHLKKIDWAKVWTPDRDPSRPYVPDRDVPEAD